MAGETDEVERSAEGALNRTLTLRLVDDTAGDVHDRSRAANAHAGGGRELLASPAGSSWVVFLVAVLLLHA